MPTCAHGWLVFARNRTPQIAGVTFRFLTGRIFEREKHIDVSTFVDAPFCLQLARELHFVVKVHWICVFEGPLFVVVFFSQGNERETNCMCWGSRYESGRTDQATTGEV